MSITGQETITSLPAGWSLQVKDENGSLWLVVLGPNGDGVALECERAGFRADALRRFAEASAKAATP